MAVLRVCDEDNRLICFGLHWLDGFHEITFLRGRSIFFTAIGRLLQPIKEEIVSVCLTNSTDRTLELQDKILLTFESNDFGLIRWVVEKGKWNPNNPNQEGDDPLLLENSSFTSLLLYTKFAQQDRFPVVIRIQLESGYPYGMTTRISATFEEDFEPRITDNINRIPQISDRCSLPLSDDMTILISIRRKAASDKGSTSIIYYQVGMHIEDNIIF
jgi:hypothetical protein